VPTRARFSARRGDTPGGTGLPRREGAACDAKIPVLRAVDAELVGKLTELVARASAAILAVAPDALDTRLKADRTPVTAADKAADARHLRGPRPAASGHRRRFGGAPGRRASAGGDVCDRRPAGRNEGIRRRPRRNHGQHRPGDGRTAGRRFHRGPRARPRLQRRGGPGRGAPHAKGARRSRSPSAVAKNPAGSLAAAVSRSHLDAATSAFLDHLAVGERMACGSALKFCRSRKGGGPLSAPVPTSEWDTAAGHAIVAAAGGLVTAVRRAPALRRLAAPFQGARIRRLGRSGAPRRRDLRSERIARAGA